MVQSGKCSEFKVMHKDKNIVNQHMMLKKIDIFTSLNYYFFFIGKILSNAGKFKCAQNTPGD